VPIGVPPLDDHVAPLEVAKLAQPAQKAGLTCARTRCHGKETNARHLPRLLRFGGERCCEEAEGDSANEGAAVHYSIT